MAKLTTDGALVKCSFCGKSQKEVKKLIAGPGIYICDECIALCIDILLEDGHVGRLDASAAGVFVPRSELTSVARTLDQAVGAMGAGNARVADEAGRLATRLHRRLQAPIDDDDLARNDEDGATPDEDPTPD
jgi:hypothetical protein